MKIKLPVIPVGFALFVVTILLSANIILFGVIVGKSYSRLEKRVEKLENNRQLIHIPQPMPEK